MKVASGRAERDARSVYVLGFAEDDTRIFRTLSQMPTLILLRLLAREIVRLRREVVELQGGPPDLEGQE